MPYEIELDRDQRIVRSLPLGEASDADLLAHSVEIRRLLDAGEIDATWVQIVDFRTLESAAAVTSEGVRQLALANPWPRAALRVVIAPTDLVYGLARMYQQQSGDKGENVRVARSEDEALALVRQWRAPTAGQA